jgi:hypothetical protein
MKFAPLPCFSPACCWWPVDSAGVLACEAAGQTPNPLAKRSAARCARATASRDRWRTARSRSAKPGILCRSPQPIPAEALSGIKPERLPGRHAGDSASEAAPSGGVSKNEPRQQTAGTKP